MLRPMISKMKVRLTVLPPPYAHASNVCFHLRTALKTVGKIYD